MNRLIILFAISTFWVVFYPSSLLACSPDISVFQNNALFVYEESPDICFTVRTEIDKKKYKKRPWMVKEIKNTLEEAYYCVYKNSDTYQVENVAKMWRSSSSIFPQVFLAKILSDKESSSLKLMLLINVINIPEVYDDDYLIFLSSRYANE